MLWAQGMAWMKVQAFIQAFTHSQWRAMSPADTLPRCLGQAARSSQQVLLPKRLCVGLAGCVLPYCCVSVVQMHRAQVPAHQSRDTRARPCGAKRSRGQGSGVVLLSCAWWRYSDVCMVLELHYMV